MRGTHVGALALLTVAAISLAVAGGGCTGAGTYSGDTKNASTTADPAAQIERGKYMVTIGGCNDCHTPGYFYGQPDMSRMLSGSELGWVGPWGTAAARNLTPDPETGLGSWTDDQIVTAIRTGQRPDGRMLAHIMPWANYGHLTDEDVRAVVAYLRSIPAVKHAVPGPYAPGETHTMAVIELPPPPAWDGQHMAAGGPGGAAPGH